MTGVDWPLTGIDQTLTYNVSNDEAVGPHTPRGTTQVVTRGTTNDYLCRCQLQVRILRQVRGSEECQSEIQVAGLCQCVQGELGSMIGLGSEPIIVCHSAIRRRVGSEAMIANHWMRNTSRRTRVDQLWRASLKLVLPELTPTHMTLELATQTVAYPVGIVEDVFVQVGKFTFLVDFVVVDYDVDP
ncbi:hypothetical protein Tco_0879233 [Tanacetum coccineum]